MKKISMIVGIAETLILFVLYGLMIGGRAWALNVLMAVAIVNIIVNRINISKIERTITEMDQLLSVHCAEMLKIGKGQNGKSKDWK